MSAKAGSNQDGSCRTSKAGDGDKADLGDLVVQTRRQERRLVRKNVPIGRKGARMKVCIKYSVEVDDADRRAIAYRFGKDGLANREDVKAFFECYGKDHAPEDALTEMLDKLSAR